MLNPSYESAMKRQCTAIARQEPATQGLSLSPMRASFQKLPSGPVLFLKHIEVSYVKRTCPDIRPVKNARPEGTDVGAGADAQKNDSEKRLEIEESRHTISETINSQVHVDEVESIIGQNCFPLKGKKTVQKNMSNRDSLRRGEGQPALSVSPPPAGKS